MDKQQTKIKITPEIIRSQKTVICECGGMVFEPGYVFKKMSALISPSGEEEMYPLETFICKKCGKVPDEFNLGKILPEEVLAKKSNLIK